MSIQAIAWALDQDDLKSMQKFVLIAIANYCNSDGESYPSQTLIARHCGITRQHVNKMVGELEALGYISVTGQTRDNGSDRSCFYELNMPAAKSPSPPKVSPTGFLYIIETPTKTKIGIARNLEVRLRAISATVGEQVKLIKKYPLPMRDARNIEKALLEQFKTCRLFGEWFSCSPAEFITAADMAVSTTMTPPPVVLVDTGESTSPTPPVVLVDTHIEPLLNHNKEPSGTWTKVDKSKGHRLPEDWTPSPKQIADAKALGLTDADIRRAAPEFRDYWTDRSGKDACKLSWDGTWRNRCRAIADRLGRKPKEANGSSYKFTRADWERAIRHYRETSNWPGPGPAPGMPGCQAPPDLYGGTLL